KMQLTMLLGRLPGRRLRTGLARRCLGLRIARGAVLYQWRDLRGAEGIEIGPETVIGHWATLDGRRGLRIGRGVNLSSEAALWTLQHDPNDRGFGVRGGPIVVEDHAWISFRATVLPGVRIGRGSVVAAGAVVTGDVEDYAIVAGIPAKRIGTRSRDLDYNPAGGGPWLV
ncbi:MAG TPA: acyltransferase, partial [Solirubrobacterales bacterium]|nr:acyltransferase [Solirubrobacterales bacterium]